MNFLNDKVCCPPALQTQIQETAISVQNAPGMRGLRACYPVSGTDIAWRAIRLRTRFPSCTDRAPLSAYACATPCP
eukprot:2833089-Rhodomonas_salina.1